MWKPQENRANVKITIMPPSKDHYCYALSSYLPSVHITVVFTIFFEIFPSNILNFLRTQIKRSNSFKWALCVSVPKQGASCFGRCGNKAESQGSRCLWHPLPAPATSSSGAMSNRNYSKTPALWKVEIKQKWSAPVRKMFLFLLGISLNSG